jgi:hypothetical protein
MRRQRFYDMAGEEYLQGVRRTVYVSMAGRRDNTKGVGAVYV